MSFISQLQRGELTLSLRYKGAKVLFRFNSKRVYKAYLIKLRWFSYDAHLSNDFAINEANNKTYFILLPFSEAKLRSIL